MRRQRRPASTTSTMPSPSATRGRCPEDRQRDARAVRVRRSGGAARPIRSARPSASPASRRSARCRAARRRRVNRMFQVVDNLSHQAGAHALRAGVDFIFNDDTITYPRAVRGSYAFSSMASFLAGTTAASRRHSAIRWSRRPTRTSACTRRTSGARAPGLTLNLGLRYDLQFLEPISTDTNNVSPRVGFAWSPSPAS